MVELPHSPLKREEPHYRQSPPLTGVFRALTEHRRNTPYIESRHTRPRRIEKVFESADLSSPVLQVQRDPLELTAVKKVRVSDHVS